MSAGSSSDEEGLQCDIFELIEDVEIGGPVATAAGPRPQSDDGVQKLDEDELESVMAMRAQAIQFAAKRRGRRTTAPVATTVAQGPDTTVRTVSRGDEEPEKGHHQQQREEEVVVEEEEGALHLANIAAVIKQEVDPRHFSRLGPQSEADASRIERWELPGCEGFVLDHVLTCAECESLIAEAVTAPGGFSFWDASNPNPRKDFRNADTVEVSHPELAQDIWRRMLPFMQGRGPQYPGTPATPPVTSFDGAWQAWRKTSGPTQTAGSETSKAIGSRWA